MRSSYGEHTRSDPNLVDMTGPLPGDLDNQDFEQEIQYYIDEDPDSVDLTKSLEAVKQKADNIRQEISQLFDQDDQDDKDDKDDKTAAEHHQPPVSPNSGQQQHNSDSDTLNSPHSLDILFRRQTDGLDQNLDNKNIGVKIKQPVLVDDKEGEMSDDYFDEEDKQVTFSDQEQQPVRKTLFTFQPEAEQQIVDLSRRNKKRKK